MSDDIYKKYNIDKNYLKRDYILNPLNKKWKRYERPFREDVEYLYIKLNIRRSDLCKIFNTSRKHIVTILKEYNLKKDPKEYHKNTENTKIEKYGDKNYFDKEKLKKTNVIRYGTNYPLQSKICQSIAEETKIKKYGDKNYNNRIKAYETCRKRSIFGKSKEEDKIYNLLIQKYRIVERQYRDNIKYPFNCDFYIPEIDTYIEYQGDRGHGGEPFINTKEQNDIVNIWKEKANEINHFGKNKTRYLKFIKMWTIEDPLKRSIAIKNKLNYLEFFNIEQFMEWFNKQ